MRAHVKRKTVAALGLLAAAMLVSSCGLAFGQKPYPKVKRSDRTVAQPLLPSTTVGPGGSVPDGTEVDPTATDPGTSVPGSDPSIPVETTSTTTAPVKTTAVPEPHTQLNQSEKAFQSCRAIATMDHRFNDILSATSIEEVRNIAVQLVQTAEKLRIFAPTAIVSPVQDMWTRINRAAPVIANARTMAEWRAIRDRPDLVATFDNPSAHVIVDWALHQCQGIQ
jgi:hypothetical protein